MTNIEQKIEEDIRLAVAAPVPEKILIKVEEPPKVTIKLNLRKALNGDYMIYDHPLYDIVIMPKKNKIVTFVKREAQLDPYISQDKFFDHLNIKGMIVGDTVQGGNIFGSLEATYPINDKVDTIQALLLVIYQFLQTEARDIKSIVDYEEDLEDYLTAPDAEDSTELGEVPHAEKKGSIDPSSRPYGLIYRI
jgi:hypothetical protein